jgi:hypothetical protein
MFLSVRPELVEGPLLSRAEVQGFDKLSPNGSV